MKYSYGASVAASSVSESTLVTINGTSNYIREFLRAGCLRIIGGYYKYYGNHNIVGNIPYYSNTLSSIAITPSSPSVAHGSTVLLTATGTFAESDTAVLTNASWSSSDLTKATVDAVGNVTGVAAGSATITVTKNGKTATKSVTIT